MLVDHMMPSPSPTLQIQVQSIGLSLFWIYFMEFEASYTLFHKRSRFGFMIVWYGNPTFKISHIIVVGKNVICIDCINQNFF